jgi:hypothetical protein
VTEHADRTLVKTGTMSVPFAWMVQTFGVLEVRVIVRGADEVADEENAPDPGAIGSGTSGNVMT